jgi:small nuclear ribonucleoprotein (snRNP)-like protein
MFGRDRDRLLRLALRERFAVTLISGDTVEGVLYAIDSRNLLLVDAHAIGEDGRRTRLDGWVYLLRSTVLYLQRPYAIPIEG